MHSEEELLPHLFRAEYRKIVAVLCRRFGFAQVESAEDIAGETFLTAAQCWGVEGLPKNPTAWLYNVAKNKALNFLKRASLFQQKIAPSLKEEAEQVEETTIDLSPQNIIDSQLQMMFAVCHPALSAEAQVGLCLRILCGFGIDEIASAFFTNKETINKRLQRAKEKLRDENITIELPSVQQMDERLNAVLTAIYLLFNEGYYSSGKDAALSKEVCFEAMRLCTMLVENVRTNKPQVNALLSLMCFHASRLDARVDKDGALVLYHEQDTGLWNVDLVSKGAYFLHCSAAGDQISKYHLEAGIAYWNTQKEDTKEKWENILQLYNRLLQIEYSPVAALNRTYALSKANGKAEAIVEAEKLQLTGNRFYFALLGELYAGIDNTRARMNFEKALALAKNEWDKQAIERRLARL